MLAILLLLLVYVQFFRSSGAAQRVGIDLSKHLSYGSLLVMDFATLWFIRYTRLVKRIAAPERHPARAAVERTLWVVLWASGLGIVF